LPNKFGKLCVHGSLRLLSGFFEYRQPGVHLAGVLIQTCLNYNTATASMEMPGRVWRVGSAVHGS
jgi:hypothetical protein